MNPDPGEPAFRLLFSGAVGERLTRLTDRALALGVAGRLAEAFRVIRDRLGSDPLDWGDPVHNLRQPGLVVYRRVHDELLVRYAVEEAERTVWLLDVIPVLGHPLCGGPT